MSRNDRRAYACDGKRREPNKLAARLAAERVGDPDLSAYRCPHCGGWHVGHNRVVRAPRRPPYKRERYLPDL